MVLGIPKFGLIFFTNKIDGDIEKSIKETTRLLKCLNSLNLKTKKKKYFLENSEDVRVFVLSAWAISLICSAIFENIDAYLFAVTAFNIH